MRPADLAEEKSAGIVIDEIACLRSVAAMAHRFFSRAS
jgi:hypothetical protein